MTWSRTGARRLIGAGLLLPSLVLGLHAGALAESPKQTKRAADKEPPAPRATTKPSPAGKAPASKQPGSGKSAAAKSPPRGKVQPDKTPQSAKAAPVRATPTRASASRTQPPAPKRPAVAAVARASADARCVHLVKGGDTVTRLAAQYGVPRQAILASNDLSSVGILKKGQKISLPGCKRGGGPREDVRGPATAVEIEHGLLLARVGPNRVPTRLFVAVPEFGNEAIDFAWPVDGVVASGFGKRRLGWHAGVDIKAESGTPVLASAAGTVIFSGWSASYGRLVKIQHSNGFVTVYAHNSENLAQVGDEVEAGRVIATVGRSGRASGHHLHFEIRREGMAFNPLHLLDTRDHTPVFVSAPAESPEMAEPLDEDPDEDVRGE